MSQPRSLPRSSHSTRVVAPSAAPVEVLRGEAARDYVLGSLVDCARHPDDLLALVPPALGWYRQLVLSGLILPFAVVLDLGHLLLDGPDFRFRGWFNMNRSADTGSDRTLHEAYETEVLVRRLQEASFPRLRRLIRDNATPDLALVHTLGLLLRPVALALPRPVALELPPSLEAGLDGLDPAVARHRFEEAPARRGLLAEQFAAVVAAAPQLSLDRRLRAEDFYEIEHIRVFPLESLREVARRIKATERLLGPPRTTTTRRLRARALAETRLNHVGTYPVGGIAELTTRGPLENLLPSELMYLEPEAPIDPFLVRFAENDLLRWLRDGSVLRLMRRSVVFVLDEQDAFLMPLTTGGELRGTKIIRALLGLVLTLCADLFAVFDRDDLAVRLVLVTPPDSATLDVERGQVADVVQLLLRDKEALGSVHVERLTSTPAAALAQLPTPTDRDQSVVVLSSLGGLAELAAAAPQRGRGAESWIAVAVRTGAAVTGTARDDGRAGAADPVVVIDFTLDAVEALRQARQAILSRVIG